MSISSFLTSSKGPHTAVGLCLLALTLVPPLVVLGRISLLKYLYPLGVFVIGFWLYAKTPVVYVGFTYWIWFITPMIRRLVDYGVGMFDPINPVMLAPLLVTSLAVISLFRFGGRLTNRAFFPFVLILARKAYGYLVGVVRAGMLSATYDILTWVLPVCFGLHVALLWRQYPSFKSAIRSTFAWSLLFLGTYGLIQYAVGPAWDMMWLQDSEMWVTMGPPEPYQFRIFSSLNSTGPFAFVCCALLILLTDAKGYVGKLALVPGFFAFLLSLVRSAWVGWALGMVYLVGWRLRGRLQKQLIGVLAAIALLAVPFFALSPLSQNVSQRAESFTELESDDSFAARLRLYGQASKRALTSPLGSGVGSLGTSAKLSGGNVRNFDSGVFDVVFSLGWLGTLLYVWGLVSLLVRTVLSRADMGEFEPFLHAVSIAYLAMMFSINQFTGVMGMMFWGTLGLAVAARLHTTRPADEPVAPVSSDRPNDPLVAA